ncbi:hypothetical protein CG747_20730 [Streptomyces sp. CB02959]|uniref:hypothetical protein n=1 Tax=Streptomyces sp. CB02959 TaxID=2020330 RepID=UPI000C2732EF|nr:hypothetical protein [Streptomyces sp. CB02959]PJN38971.1 hypothetical protein CG747_20730 [Streptomyces sp. CB02959]
MRTRATTAVLAALLPVALTACSSTGDGKTAKKPPVLTTPTNHAPSATADQARADLEKAVRTYTAAYFKPDVTTAYSLISTRCREQITKPGLGMLLDRAHKASGARTVKTFTIDKFSGDMARVSYGVGEPQYDQHDQPWTREGGHWRFDAC